jgi:hypothetical protein
VSERESEYFKLKYLIASDQNTTLPDVTKLPASLSMVPATSESVDWTFFALKKAWRFRRGSLTSSLIYV